VSRHFRPLPLDSKKLDEGLIDFLTAVDLPHGTPGNANVCTTARKLGPACTIPAVQVTCSIGSGDVVAITTSAVDGLQITWNWLPRILARQHAVDCPTRVDVPLLAVGPNGNMDTRARKLVRATILVLPQFLLRVNVDGTIISPCINLEGGK
jgi:hypothetical protein